MKMKKMKHSYYDQNNNRINKNNGEELKEEMNWNDNHILGATSSSHCIVGAELNGDGERYSDDDDIIMTARDIKIGGIEKQMEMEMEMENKNKKKNIINNQDNNRLKVGIIGCGIAGLVQAILLSKQGYHVEIFEKQKNFKPVLGAGLSITTSILVLREMGLEILANELIEYSSNVDRVMLHRSYGNDLGSVKTTAVIHDNNKNKNKKNKHHIQRKEESGKIGWMTRHDIHRILRKHLPKNVKIHFNHKLIDLNEYLVYIDENVNSDNLEMKSIVECYFIDKDDDVDTDINTTSNNNNNINNDISEKTSYKFDFVIGADGLHSNVRKIIFKEENHTPKYTGFSIIYGLTKTNKVQVENKYDYTKNGHFTYLQEKGLFLHFPCGKNNEDVLYVMAFPRETPIKQTWNIDGTREECLEILQNALSSKGNRSKRSYDSNHPFIKLIMESHQILKFGLHTNKPLTNRWHSSSSLGKVVLIGDAVHATTPFVGQGANQAILDACCLSKLLGKYYSPFVGDYSLSYYDSYIIDDIDDEQKILKLDEIFNIYFQMRSKQANAIMKTSHSIGHMHLMGQTWKRQIRDTCLKLGLKTGLLPKVLKRIMTPQW